MVMMLLAKLFFLVFLFLLTFFLILYNHPSIFQLTNFNEFQIDADWPAVQINQNETNKDRKGTRVLVINLNLNLSLLFSVFKHISSSSIS